MIAAYLRVSSASQDAASQRDAIERAAAARGDSIGEWFSEKLSAKTMKRPELERLRTAVRAGTVRRVYTFKLDRLCRTGVADTFGVVEDFKRAGTELVAVADNLALKPGDADIASEVFVFALGLAARLERLAGEERRAAARERLKAAGKPWGRPQRMDAAQVARAQELRSEGRSVRQVAIAMKVPRATIARALARASQKSPPNSEG